MLRASKTLLTAAAGAVLGLAATAASTAPASAYSYTRCDYDGDHCVRVNCDWDGDRCMREYDNYRHTYYRDNYYRGSRRWVCDADGDRCHWIYENYPYY